jgi:hypothetical protein
MKCLQFSMTCGTLWLKFKSNLLFIKVCEHLEQVDKMSTVKHTNKCMYDINYLIISGIELYVHVSECMPCFFIM